MLFENKEKLKRASEKRSKCNTKYGNDEMKQSKHCSMEKTFCLFRQKKDGHLHEFRTLDADETMRHNMAIELQEAELIARMEGGDLVAIDVKYHLRCLTDMRNRYRLWYINVNWKLKVHLKKRKYNQEFLWNCVHT